MPASSCDVLVVGGGPAGSSCARRLGELGFDVIVLDRKTFPRNKICAGWITPQIVDELQIDLDEYANENILQPITGFRVSVMGHDESHLTYDQPVSYGIRRCEFDHYLLERSGATLRLGEALQSIEKRDGGFIVNGEIETRLIIGAGGHFCPVARHMGASPTGHGQLIVAAQETEFEMTSAQRAQCAVSGDVPELFFCEDLAGYAWCFRKGDYLNIGLGREDTEKISEHVRDFCTFLEERGRVPRGIESKFSGHAYILYGHTRRRLIDDGMMLIGDAAGLAYPQSGEGIRPAIESGLIAANVIAAAAGDYGVNQLEPYTRQLIARYGRPKSPQRGLLNLLPAGFKQSIAANLLGADWFARNVVVDRWFLHRHEPALAL